MEFYGFLVHHELLRRGVDLIVEHYADFIVTHQYQTFFNSPSILKWILQ